MNDAAPPPGYATADWADANGKRWAAQADRLEAQLEPVADVLFDAAALSPGQHVLDVGCGRGATTRRAAAIVGPAGTATGLDVSAALLDEAGGLAAGIANIDWVVADAQRFDFGSTATRFDTLISRFGVMFFDDARAAFANLRTAAVPGASMTLAVWQHRDRSPLFELPLAFGRDAAARLGVPFDESTLRVDAGPFSLGDPDAVTTMLEAAGWTEVRIAPSTLTLHNGGPGTPDDAAEVALTVGALRVALEPASDAQRAQVRAVLVERFAELHDGVGVALDGAVNIVQARA